MKQIDRLKERAKSLKNEILALSLVLKDSQTPWYAKTIIGITIAYALSPVDLIPDFIPVLGYLDDLIILPALIIISIKLIPNDVLEDCRNRVADGYKLNKKSGWIAGAVIILLWVLLIVLLIF